MWQRQELAWESPTLLGRRMELVVHGHAGPRVLVFPTSQGSVNEWEDRGMCAAMADRLESGAVQFLCVGSADDASWYNERIAPHERAAWQARYDTWIRDEVLRLKARGNKHPDLITVGASFGGYHALCFGLRYPHLVKRILSMSGLVDIRRFTGGWSDDLVYFYNPAEFMRNEHDPARLHALRKLDIILAVGRDDTLCEGNEHLSAMLWEQGIGNALRVWDGWAHDWPWWQKMMVMYLDGHD